MSEKKDHNLIYQQARKYLLYKGWRYEAVENFMTSNGIDPKETFDMMGKLAKEQEKYVK